MLSSGIAARFDAMLKAISRHPSQSLPASKPEDAMHAPAPEASASAPDPEPVPAPEPTETRKARASASVVCSSATTKTVT